MSRPLNLNEGETNGFPRVSGDEPRMTPETIYRLKFSPRERG